MRAAGRRAMLQQALLASLLLALPVGAMAQEASAGCSLSYQHAQGLDSSRGIGVVGQELVFTTGDEHKNKLLGRALVRLSQLFGERPGFGFIDDSRSPNAYASKGGEEDRVPGTWGTVRFGRTLFDDLTHRFDDDGIAILAVIAHEFGHIAQYRRGVMDALNAGQSTVRRSELHADLLAGYFLGTRKMADGRIKLRSAGLALFSIGDYEFNSRDHHGTPEERVEAAEYGYQLAQEQRSFDEAFKLGMRWILTRFKEEAGSGT